jgi:hypothetical protein
MSNDVVVQQSGEIQKYDDLSRVVHKALQQIEIILDMEVPEEGNEDRMKMLSVKKDAAASIINAGLKADENRFRRENKDIIEKLFDKIKKESKLIDGSVSRRV